ncbi:P68 family surface lipoprotein [Mycoplasma leonicaptivi]|uniref:P68 family surface lipoprotein n=1 Tax=Mycoplasma leonicaptivi TaxID=36742 RepID=UPI000484D7A3|nr:P80 family lipoprotein [Mycoplasma leonicaptivi]
MNKKFKKIFQLLLPTVGFSAVAASCGNYEKNNEETNPEWMLNFLDDDSKAKYQEQINNSKSSKEVSALYQQIKQELESKGINTNRIENSAYGANPEGADKTFNQTEKDKILLGTSFSLGGHQVKGISFILAEYNKQVKAGKLGPKAKIVEHEPLGSGYPAGLAKTQRELGSQNKDGFYNMIINYPNVAIDLANYNMLMSFNSFDKNTNFDINSFDSKFVSANFDTEKIFNEGTYILPLLKSTNVLTMNTSVLSYVLDTLKENGVSIQNGDRINFDELIEKGRGDREAVKELWGLPITNINVLLEESGYKGQFVLNQDVFSNYSDLIKFANLVQKMFTKSSVGASSDVHVLGIDDAAGVFYQSLYAELDGDNSLMPVSKDETTKTYRYNNLYVGGEGTFKAQTIFRALNDSVNLGATVMFNNGQYASVNQKYHKILFGIASTTGYAYNFIKDTEDNVSYQGNTGEKFSTNFDLKRNVDNFVLLNNSLKNKEKPAETILYVGKYNNPVFESPDFIQKEYDVALANSQDRVKMEQFLGDNINSSIAWLINEEIINKNPVLNKLLEITNDNFMYFDVVKGTKNIKNKMLIFKGVYDNKKKTVFDTKLNEILKPSLFKKVTLSQQEVLNESELFATNTPSKWRKENKQNVIFSQGPSIMGIHSNPSSNEATRIFMKWLIDSKEKVNWKQHNKELKTDLLLTPLEYFQSITGYITPIKGFKDQNNEIKDKIIGKNKFLEIAFESFVNASNTENTLVFEEPVGQHSDKIRSEIRAAWDDLQKNAVNGESNKNTYDTWVQKATASTRNK